MDELKDLMARAEQGDADAKYALAMKYIYADGVEEDNVKAAELLEQAAEEGHREAAYHLGICYHYGYGVEKDIKTAYQLYLRSALQGYGKGFDLVGDFYAEGLGVRQNYREAIKWYLDATVSSDPDAVSYAEYKMAGCLAHGLGVEKDEEKAVELYEQALAHGEARAKPELERLGYYDAFRIRPGRMEDAAVIQRLNAEELGYDYPVEAVEKCLESVLERDSERVFVAVSQGQVVGYVHACGYETLYAPAIKNILGIAVMAGCRRKGIGRALLEKVEVWAAETGAAGVRLVSGAEREDAHRFYAACGYACVKQQVNFKKWFSVET